MAAALVPRTILAASVTAKIDNIAILEELVKAIGAAGDALAKLADGVKHLVETGAEGYDAVKARYVNERLRDLSAMITLLSASQQKIPPSLKAYAQNVVSWSVDEGNHQWVLIVTRLKGVLQKVNGLLARLSEERSDLVLQPAYAQLANALNGRVTLIEQLLDMPAPKTNGELQVVRQAATKYEILIAQLKRARDNMNEYVKQVEKIDTSNESHK